MVHIDLFYPNNTDFLEKQNVTAAPPLLLPQSEPHQGGFFSNQGMASIQLWLRTWWDCDPYSLIWEAVYGVVMSKKAYSWYKHSEYIV